MGKSFVLKDEAGRPGGYLMQGLREICCRASGLTRQAQAVLLFEDGTAEAHALGDDREARWPDGGRLLRGGFVCSDGRLLLATGEEARGAFERLSMQKRAAKQEKRIKAENAEEPAQERTQETEAPPAPAQETHAWPQRRWPPPPCWPQAVYAQGRWQERT